MKYLKAFRVKLGISQSDLAELVGVTTTWINKIENNKKKSPKLEKRICELLHKIESEKRGLENIPTLS